MMETRRFTFGGGAAHKYGRRRKGVKATANGETHTKGSYHMAMQRSATKGGGGGQWVKVMKCVATANLTLTLI